MGGNYQLEGMVGVVQQVSEQRGHVESGLGVLTEDGV